FSSLEEAYEALRTFEILGIIEKKPDVRAATCHCVSETFWSTSSTSKDLYASKVNGILKCDVDGKVLEGVVPRLQAAVSDAGSLLDFYYSIGSLVLIKDQTSKEDLHLVDAEGVFHSIK
ncbi:LOW QUALITY PROTEIN: Ribophorin_II domain-containing protein, partial [Cephalotus follicularis]